MSNRSGRHYDSSRVALSVALVLLILPVGGLHADGIYESVDAQGNVTYSDRSSDLSSGNHPAEIVSLETAPPVLHFCWTNCFTLLLKNGVYIRADGSDEKWTVERFNSHAVVLHRHDPPADWNGFSADVTYGGRVAGSRLIEATVGGRAIPDIQMSWGAALHTLPGSNVERDRHGLPVASDGGGYADVSQAPPPVPDEEQPTCPVDGYLWTPGYWAWRSDRYYWVTGAWVRPPHAGQLWTPGYWAYTGGNYRFHTGHWAPTVGYYGGINYGFGYGGTGFAGGRWVNGVFLYNTAANHVDASVVHHTYINSAPRADNSSPGVGAQQNVTAPSAAKKPRTHAAVHSIERNKT